MPSQRKIINAVNHCLKQKPASQFLLNKRGVCAGLSSLYIKESLENKSLEFFNNLNQLSNIPSTYKLGDNSKVDAFIIDIENTQKPEAYSNNQTIQGELEKLLCINNMPLRNEFNFGLITEESTWETILALISREGRGYFIGSHNHAVAMFYKNGQYIVYDPNFKHNTKICNTAREMLTAFKGCFQYQTSRFGLSIRVFSHPEKPACSDYPNKKDLHNLASQNEEHYRQLSEEGDKPRQSTSFACYALDKDSLNILFEKQAVDKSLLGGNEFSNNAFIKRLLQESNWSDWQAVFLQALPYLIEGGYADLTRRMIEKYNSDQAASEPMLGSVIARAFRSLHLGNGALISKEEDKHYFLNLIETLNLENDPYLLTNYNYMQLLHLCSKGYVQDIDAYLSHLESHQLIKQLCMAAQFGKHFILDRCIQQAQRRHINFRQVPSPFTATLLKTINGATLKVLLNIGLVVDPSLFPICMQRIEKTIFAQYFDAWLEQTGYPPFRILISSPAQLAAIQIKDFSILYALIYFNKNHLIKQFWNNQISEDQTINALYYALCQDNEEISLFLKAVLDKNKVSLDPDFFEFLYYKALEEDNLISLGILVRLNYNILHSPKEWLKILSLCDVNKNFSVVLSAFDLASNTVKKQFLALVLQYDFSELDHYFLREELSLLTELYLEIISNSQYKNRNLLLALLDRNYQTLQPDIIKALITNFPEQELKTFIIDCFSKKNTTLAKGLYEHVTWTIEEENNLLSQLLAENNEIAVQCLLKIQKNLQQSTQLFYTLYKRNMLTVLSTLLFQVPDNLSKDLFQAAIKSGHQRLLTSLIQDGRIPPPELLSIYLVTAIKAGKFTVLEPFVTIKKDCGINFKQLFLLSSQYRQAEIANLILAKDIVLDEKEIHTVIHNLFEGLSSEEIFDVVYQKSWGRLYGLALKIMKHPHEKLLSSIRNPEQELKFQKIKIYTSFLIRALIEKDSNKFHHLLQEAELPEMPEDVIFVLLRKSIVIPDITLMLERKYSWQSLLVNAMNQENWEVVAILLENHSLDKLPEDIILRLNLNKELIVYAFVKAINQFSGPNDLRARLFNLLNTGSDGTALKYLSRPFTKNIHLAIVSIELHMLDKKYNLNNQIYRYQLENKPFKNALNELLEHFQRLKDIIHEDGMDLALPVDNKRFIAAFCRIKALMTKFDITPWYLPEEEEQLLTQVINNSRFKKVCQLEITLYSFIRQVHLKGKALTTLTNRQQEEFHASVSALKLALSQQNLSHEFLIPEISPWLDARNGLEKVVKKYINKRSKLPNTGLSFFQYTKEDKKRAGMQLIRALKDSKYLISDKHLKALNNKRMHDKIFDYLLDNEQIVKDTFHSKESLNTVESLVKYLNKQNPIGKLIFLLETYRDERERKPDTYHSTQFTKQDKITAANRLIAKLKFEPSLFQSKDVNALKQGTLGKKIRQFLDCYQKEIGEAYNMKPIKNIESLLQACGVLIGYSQNISLTSNLRKLSECKNEGNAVSLSEMSL